MRAATDGRRGAARRDLAGPFLRDLPGLPDGPAVPLRTLLGDVARARHGAAVNTARVRPGELELAQTFGATDTVNPAAGDAVAQVLELTGGGVTHAFEVIGLKQTSEQALAMLKVDIPMYARLYLQGRFKLDELVSHRIALGDIDRGYELLRAGGVARSVITDF